MPRKISSAKIYRQRRDNYAFHFEQRQLCKVLPVEMLLLYQKLIAVLPAPVLNAWGAGTYSDREWDQVIKLAIAKNLPCAYYLVSWYLSDSGWLVFQDEWQNLPDVICFPPQEPLWTNVYNSGLVHISTWEEETFAKLYTGKG